MGGRPLIVGIDGMIGSALFAAAGAKGLEPAGTTRRLVRPGGRTQGGFSRVDLEFADTAELPETSVAYLCAGVVGYKICEGNPLAHRVNVDGTIAIAKRLARAGAFIVFMSSDAAERMQGTAYGLHKALVEMFLQTITDPAIVRAGRVEPHMLPGLCELLLDLGQSRRPGIFHFAPETHGPR